MKAIIPRKIEEYCLRHTSPRGKLLQELEKYTRRNCTDARMLIGPHEGTLLAMLVRLSDARRVLEIGTFTGYSALCLAGALPKNGRLLTCEIKPEHAVIAQSFFDRSRHGCKIKIHLGPALETLAGLPRATKFDFVFLDADKENYVNYYEAVLPRLRAGGLIVADNVLWSGRVLAPKKQTDRAVVRFNRHARRDARVECVMLPVRDGVSLIRKR
ncbi:O-methyltransferase [Sulfuricaulis limicola]|uniref:O-methyltransferase n=1 Tax=Sulfuricaulis limicola TaxID=1620215 RepID=A0A1B4XJJ5_9GAMM|nr:class I SAM-dependent methyltransferase [Sulfuricaulis limicola]BAV34979.1 O-methyltransferase [Sulfuricaulis limicola]